MAQQGLKAEIKQESKSVAKVVTKQIGNKEVTRSNMNPAIYLPDTKDAAYKFAETFSKSAFCPVAYKNKPADVYLSMAYGAQIGLNPLLAVQNIAMINGRPSVYGDALTAIVLANPETELYEDGYKDNNQTAYCYIKRNGRTIKREFTVEMARKAGLWGKSGPWTTYPERMLLWRAKGWAIRDAYSDVLMGMWSVEESRDTPISVMNITPEYEEEEAVEEVGCDNQQTDSHDSNQPEERDIEPTAEQLLGDGGL